MIAFSIVINEYHGSYECIYKDIDIIASIINIPVNTSSGRINFFISLPPYVVE